MAMTQALRSSPLRGILLMMGALARFALLDTLSKGLTASHPVPVIVWGRYAVHFRITLLLIMAFRAAPATTPSPLSYAQLAWATLFGWIAFGDLPDGASFAGMGIIAASGLGAAYLERRKREEPVRE